MVTPVGYGCVSPARIERGSASVSTVVEKTKPSGLSEALQQQIDGRNDLATMLAEALYGLTQQCNRNGRHVLRHQRMCKAFDLEHRIERARGLGCKVERQQRNHHPRVEVAHQVGLHVEQITSP